MGFIIIPFALILASVGGIFFIVWRKLPYLEELARSESSNGISVNKDWHNVFYDLCPEVLDWAKSIRTEEYKEMWLIETEKLLRRLRLVSLKMDRLSDTLIKKIRKRTYLNGTLTYVAEDKAEEKVEDIKSKPVAEVKENKKEEFKKAEQKLIIEIAKNPKSASLYEELGDLYVGSGDYRDAKESYEAAIELSPQNESLKKKLSQALEKLT